MNMYKAEWYDQEGKYQSKIFDSELSAIEFACDAYLDCLVSVSVRHFTWGNKELNIEYEHYIASQD